MKTKHFPSQVSSLARVSLCVALASNLLYSQPSNQPTELEETVQLKSIVVTAPEHKTPLEVVLDAKVPYQPIPAQDGADYLKSIPGFSVIRKGGTDGDPTLRGQAGSRLGISLDGQSFLGGCGFRMDPPTAYVFPSAYDTVTLLKGPQSVRHGPGISAGVVRFETSPRRMDTRRSTLDSNITVGSFDRLDASLDATVGTPDYFARVALTRTESSDYEDGAGNAVHSNHMRWSANATLGWTPSDDTSLLFSMVRSDGEAAYSDRMMDGAIFDRESYQISFKHKSNEGLIESTKLDFGYNYIDHVMDNYSLRTFTPNMMMPKPSASNPDRESIGGRALFDFATDENFDISLGFDLQGNTHSIRKSMNQPEMPYESMKRNEDAEFSQFGIFGDMSYELSDQTKLVAGLRLDDWQAEDMRQNVSLGMMGFVPNPTANHKRDAQLLSGFVRFESQANAYDIDYYAGIGYVERFLDYWELIKNESVDSVSAFYEAPERTTQLDIGFSKQFGPAKLTLAAFYSDVDEFALVESGYSKPMGMMGSRSAIVTRGIAAQTWGGEAAFAWRFSEHWILDASLAGVRGENETDDLPLAQISPLESRLSLNYNRDNWSLGALLRAVDKQDRVAPKQGNIVGQDIGPTPGFAVFSLNGSVRLSPTANLSAGIDNLFDKDYAEHISRAGSSIAGFVQTQRVNEPGRLLWLRLDYSY